MTPLILLKFLWACLSEIEVGCFHMNSIDESYTNRAIDVYISVGCGHKIVLRKDMSYEWKKINK